MHVYMYVCMYVYIYIYTYIAIPGFSEFVCERSVGREMTCNITYKLIVTYKFICSIN